MCSVASGKCHISGMAFKFDIWFLFLSDDGSYRVSATYWTVQHRRSSSSTPRRVEHTPVNFSNIVKSLLAINDGKGGAPS